MNIVYGVIKFLLYLLLACIGCKLTGLDLTMMQLVGIYFLLQAGAVALADVEVDESEDEECET